MSPPKTSLSDKIKLAVVAIVGASILYKSYWRQDICPLIVYLSPPSPNDKPNSAMFDLYGNGEPISLTWPGRAGLAFLISDTNSNGFVDNGTELIGTRRGEFSPLKPLDSSGDGYIDAADLSYSTLALWSDDGNGITEPGEFRTLADMELRLKIRNKWSLNPANAWLTLRGNDGYMIIDDERFLINKSCLGL